MAGRLSRSVLSVLVLLATCGSTLLAEETQEEKNEQKIYQQAHAELKEKFTAAKENFTTVHEKFEKFREAMGNWRKSVTQRNQKKSIDEINKLLDGVNDAGFKTALEQFLGQDAIKSLEELEERFDFKLSDKVNLLDAVGADPRKQWDWMYNLSAFDRKLKNDGIYDRLNSVKDLFDKASPHIDRVGQLTEFMSVFDPTSVDQTKPGGSLRAVGNALKYASSLAENVPGIGHLINFYIEATDAFADALDRLDGKIKDARQGALGGQFRDNEGIQKAFAKLCPDSDFHSKMFLEITDERPALKPATDQIGPRVWEHFEDKRIFLFLDADRAALLSGTAFGHLYDGFAGLRNSAVEAHRELVSLDEFVSIVQAAGAAGSDIASKAAEYDALYQKLCGPDSLQMRRVLVHVGEISDPYQGVLVVTGAGGKRLEFPVLSTRAAEFRGLCFYSAKFREAMRRLVSENQDRMVITLMLISSDSKLSVRDPKVLIDGQPVTLEVKDRDYELLLPRRSYFDMRIDAAGFLPVVGKYSFGIGGTVRVVLQTVTPGEPGSVTPPAGTAPTGTNPPPEVAPPTQPPIPPGQVKLTIQGASETLPGMDVSLTASVAGTDLTQRRLAIVWYDAAKKQEIARGESYVLKAPASGTLGIIAQVEEPQASGKPLIHASARHDVKVVKLQPVTIAIRCDREIVPLGSSVRLSSQLTAPGIPWSRLRLEWSHQLGKENSATFKGTTPGPAEVRLSVFQKLESGEVKVGEAVHKLIVVSTKLIVPQSVLQGKAFDLGIQPAPQLAARVKHYAWSGGDQFTPASKSWNELQGVDAPRISMMYPINRFAPEANAARPLTISVDLQDENHRSLYRAEATSQLRPVALNGSASDVWEGGANERNFGLNRKDSHSAPLTIGGTTSSTARVGGTLRLELESASRGDSLQALQARAQQEASQQKNFTVIAISIPPFRGYLIKERSVHYKAGGGSPLTGYRDAGSIRQAHGWLINGPTQLKVSFYAAGSGRFDNSDEAWLKSKTEAVFGEAEAIIGSLSFQPDGRFQQSKYTGPALDGSQDVPPLKLVLDGPTQDVPLGQNVSVQAQVTGGRTPYQFVWNGEHAGSGASVRVPTLRPGAHQIAVTVTSQDGQSESASLTYRVAGTVGKLTGLPHQVQFGKEYSLGVTLPGGLNGARVYWQASPNVEFSRVETTVQGSASASTSSTRVLFDRCPDNGVKLWAQLIDEHGATIGEAEQITVAVQKPSWSVSFTPQNPFVGQRLEVNVTPSWPIRADLFDFNWTTPASGEREELTDNASRIAIVPRNMSPLTLHAEVRVPQAGDDLGEVRQTLGITAAKYTVVASIVDSGPQPKVWKTGVGLVDVPRGTCVVDQRVLLQAQIPGYPNPSVVRWKWSMNEGTSLTNSDARYPTATRHEPGTATLTAVATDPDGIELGSATVTFQVIPQSVDVLPGAGGAAIAGTAPVGGPGTAGTATGGSTSTPSPSVQATQLATVAVTQADQGDFEAAVSTVKQIRDLDAGVGYSTADAVAERLQPAAEQAERDWDFDRSGELYGLLHQLQPASVEAARGVARAPVYAQRKREVETWRSDVDSSLDRGDWDRAEQRLKSIRLWEDTMPGTPRPETERLTARYDELKAAYDVEFSAFQKDVSADHDARRLEAARSKLLARLQRGGLTRSDRDWINGMLVATEQLSHLPAPKVTPLQQPWAGVARIETLWTLDVAGTIGELGLSVAPDRIAGWVDLGAGREPLSELTYDRASSTIRFVHASASQVFSGLVNGSRMQGPFTAPQIESGTWIARLKSTTVVGDTGQPAGNSITSSGWLHASPAIPVAGGTATAIPGNNAGQAGSAVTATPGAKPGTPSSVMPAPAASGTQSPAGVAGAGGLTIQVVNGTTVEHPAAPAATTPGTVPGTPVAGAPGNGTLSAGQVLARVSGQWTSREYREEPKVFGVFEVKTAGKLRAEIDTDPHAKPIWSLWNADTGLVVSFEPKRGSGYGPAITVAAATGLIVDKANNNQPLMAEGSWPGPGRLTVACPPPGGSGPLTGSQFAQSYKGVVEITEISATAEALAGQLLQNGDRIRVAEGGAAIIASGTSRYRIGANSDVTITTAPDGKTGSIFDIRSGSIRVADSSQAANGSVRDRLNNATRVRVQLSGKTTPDTPQPPAGPVFTVTPRGTDYEVFHQGETARVVVYSGAVDVAGPDAELIAVAAGQSLTLPGTQVAPVDTRNDPGLALGGLPATSLPFDDRIPEPAGEFGISVVDGQLGDGWLWQDPGADAQLAAPQSDTVQVTVPDGNEFWEWTSTAPRMLHKVTGDFDLTCELQLQCAGNQSAMTEFMIYSPGSYIGQHAGQSKDWLMVHYRIMGGGWLRHQNFNVLPEFRRTLEQCSPAPDHPIQVRMTRRGNVFRTYWSLDGSQWTLSSRAEMDVSDTIWSGLLFKRIAFDGLREAPAVSTIRNLRLTSREPLTETSWDIVGTDGQTQSTGQTVELTLDGTRNGNLQAIATPVLTGDVDVIVQYALSGWQHQPGQYRSLNVALSTLEDPDRNATYISLAQHDSFSGARFTTDLMLNGQWGRHQVEQLNEVPTTGWMRLIRHADRVTTFYWNEGEWNILGLFVDKFPQPVELVLSIANDWSASSSAPLQVKFDVIRIASGEEAAKGHAWSPPGVGVLADVPVPAGLTLPSGVQSRQWRSPFPLGRVFFDERDNAYVFSSSRDRGKLVRITPDGVSETIRRGDVFAGVSYKSAVFDGQDLLVTVDGWAESGNVLSGLYRVKPDGSFHQITLSSNFGDLGDIIRKPSGGWYLAEFGVDNIFDVQRSRSELPDVKEAATATALITSGDRPPGMRELLLDPRTQTLLTLNVTGGYPFGGKSGVYAIQNGAAAPFVMAPEGVTYESLDVTTRSALGDGVFVLTSTGQLIRNSWEGYSATALTGLTGYRQIRFSPTGALYAVGGEDGRLLLKLWSAGPPASIAITAPTMPAPTVKPVTPPPVSVPPVPGLPGSAPTARGYFGVNLRNAGHPDVQRLNIRAASGAVITRVWPDSPAARAGLQIGDVIVSCNGTLIASVEELVVEMKDVRVGARYVYDIHRGRQAVRAEVVLGPWPAGMSKAEVLTPGATPGPAAGQVAGQPVGRILNPRPKLIGIWSESAGSPKARQLGIESPLGAVISQVQAGSPADRAGLRAGDLVVEFGGMPIENYEDLEAATLSSAVGSIQRVVIVRGMQRGELKLPIAPGDPQRPPLVTFTHPTNAYTFQLPSSWQIAAGMQRDPTSNRMFRGAQSRDGNYLLYVYEDSHPAPSADAALQEFLRQTLPQERSRRIGRITLGGFPGAYVGVSGGTEQRRVVAYRVAFVINNRRFDVDAIAPPLSNPEHLTEVLTAILNTLQSIQSK
ncbi:MAG: PDZ domain-containing protein [Rhodopirellula sp.]|nr:PDZ domain-containing protein [Rhodopirellula sp.]